VNKNLVQVAALLAQNSTEVAQSLDLAQADFDVSTQKASDLSAQLSDAQKRVQVLTDTLGRVTADDTSVAAQLLAAQDQLSRLVLLANPGMGLNLHRQPSVQDPNARPIMTWFQPGNTGNSQGTLTKPHGPWSITQMDGYAQFKAMPAAPNDNFFWALNFFKATQTLREFVQVSDFEIPDEILPDLMGVERNWEQSIGGYRINAGIQLLLGTDKDSLTGKPITNKFRYYDIIAGHWVTTSIPFDRASMVGTGKRLKLVSVFQAGATPAAGMTNVGLIVNGTPYTIGVSTKGLASNWGPYLQTGFQLDSISTNPLIANVYDDQGYWL
jgi:hypothetical protein